MDGRRVTGQNRRQPVRVELGRRTAWLSGPGVAEALRLAGSPSMRCPKRRVWCCPVDRVSDVLAVVEGVQGRRIELVEAER